MKTNSIICIIIFMLSINFAKAQNSEEIMQEELLGHVKVLASDEFQGRQPGTKGDSLAAAYIKRQFEIAGLQLLGENGYQYFDVITGAKAGENNTFVFNNQPAEFGVEYIPLSFTANATIEAEIVFAGYGFIMQTDSLNWNDYSNIDVKNKIVMVLNGDPEPENRNSEFIPFSNSRSKLIKAQDAGAAAVIIVNSYASDNEDNLPELKTIKGISRASIPIIQISRTLADKILDSSGKNIKILEEQINKNKQPASFNTGSMVKIETDIEYETSKTQNVIAYIEGADEKLKHEYVIIGAHFDHLGMGGLGSSSRMPDTIAVHNGADDNASGVAAIIEIAEKMSQNSTKMKRSLMIIAFSGEELGLLGSKHYTANPIFPLNKAVCMLNFDMIGRLDTTTKAMMVGGTGTFDEQTFLDKLFETSNLNPTFAPEGFGPSDHAAFYAKDISVLFFSTPAHDDYHTPNDDVEFINFDGMRAISEIGYNAALHFITTDKKPVFTEAGPKENNSTMRGFKVTLGIMPAFAGGDDAGLGVDGVRKEGPAGVAGMKKGDKIVALNGKPVKNIYEYMDRLAALNKGDLITVDVIRNNEKLILMVQL